MSDDDADAQRFAEVLKLAFVDGLGVRAIARRDIRRGGAVSARVVSGYRVTAL